MSIDEFDKLGISSRMAVTYKGETRYVGSVDFDEKLFGLLPKVRDCFNSLDWVRVENVELVK